MPYTDSAPTRPLDLQVSPTLLYKGLPTLLSHSSAITNTALHLGHHPHPWKFFTTIMLRKPGKPDYTVPKAYRPIALKDTMSKVTESIIAR
jgi:hypothetical protein